MSKTETCLTLPLMGKVKAACLLTYWASKQSLLFNHSQANSLSPWWANILRLLLFMTQACLNLTWPVKHSKASNPCLFYTSLIDPCFILYKSHRPLFYSIQVSSTLVLFYTSLFKPCFLCKQAILAFFGQDPFHYFFTVSSRSWKVFILRVGYKRRASMALLTLAWFFFAYSNQASKGRACFLAAK